MVKRYDVLFINTLQIVIAGNCGIGGIKLSGMHGWAGGWMDLMYYGPENPQQKHPKTVILV